MADYRMGCFLTAIRKEAADLFCSSRSLFKDWCVFFLPTLASENYSSGKKEAGRAGRAGKHGMSSMPTLGIWQIPTWTYMPCSTRRVGIQVVVCAAE